MPLFKKAVVGYRDEAPAPTRRGPLRGFVGAPNPDIQAEGFGLLETSPFDGFRNALREILGGRFVLEGDPRPLTGRRAHYFTRRSISFTLRYRSTMIRNAALSSSSRGKWWWLKSPVSLEKRIR